MSGRYSSIWFLPTKTGEYHLFCAEYCGTRHSGMIGTVYVMEPDEYQAWLSGGAGTGSMSARGEQLFQQLACSSCHLSDGTGRGPSLAGVFGSQVKMQGGQMSGMDHPQHAIAPQTAPPAPASTAAVARLSPAATLSTDAFDSAYDPIHQDGFTFTLRGDPTLRQESQARITRIRLEKLLAE